MTRKDNNPIVSLVSRVVSPFIMIYALYVIFHGHYSPGGGFQGGVLLASSMILHRLSLGRKESYAKLAPRTASVLGTGGMFMFILQCLLIIAFHSDGG